MVDNAPVVPLKSDVIVASHHGGNNGNARCFIEAVDPDFVIFSAGHNYHHPTQGAAQRYLAHGVGIDNMFRTDRGDHEPPDEDELPSNRKWPHGRVDGCHDGTGDDDVDIVLGADGSVEVAYRQASTGC